MHAVAALYRYPVKPMLAGPDPTTGESSIVHNDALRGGMRNA